MLVFSFFLVIDLYFLIPAAIAQIFNFIAELVIPKWIPSKVAKAEIEVHPVIAKANVCHQEQKALVKHFFHIVLTNGINLI